MTIRTELVQRILAHHELDAKALVVLVDPRGVAVLNRAVGGVSAAPVEDSLKVAHPGCYIYIFAYIYVLLWTNEVQIIESMVFWGGNTIPLKRDGRTDGRRDWREASILW